MSKKGREILSERRVLVGITAQTGSEKLIDYAHSLAQEVSGRLYVLHIEKGTDIFRTEEAALQLQRLFVRASKCNAEIHAICGQDIFCVFKKFIRKENITDLVIGEPPNTAPGMADSIYERLVTVLPQLRVHLIEKNKLDLGEEHETEGISTKQKRP